MAEGACLFLVLAVVFLGPPVLVAWGALRLRRKGRLKFRTWVLAVFLVSVLLSFGIVNGGMGCAFLLWITGGEQVSQPLYALWRTCFLLLYLLWPVTLTVLLVFRAVTDAAGRIPWGKVGLVVCIVTPMFVLDAGVLLFMLKFETSRSVAVAPSPDGRMQVRAISITLIDIEHELVVESNTRFPLVGRRLVFAEYEDGEWADRHRLIWSSDSQVVTLWVNQTPVLGYDFSKNQALGEHISRKALTTQFNDLMAAHGGAASE
jgi:hypothetical protein